MANREMGQREPEEFPQQENKNINQDISSSIRSQETGKRDQEELQAQRKKIEEFFDEQINEDKPTKIIPEGWTPKITEQQKRDYRVRALELDEQFLRDTFGAEMKITPRQAAEELYQDLYEHQKSLSDQVKKGGERMRTSGNKMEKAMGVGVGMTHTVFEKTGANRAINYLHRGLGKAYTELRARSLARKEKREAKNK